MSFPSTNKNCFLVPLSCLTTNLVPSPQFCPPDLTWSSHYSVIIWRIPATILTLLISIHSHVLPTNGVLAPVGTARVDPLRDKLLRPSTSCNWYHILFQPTDIYLAGYRDCNIRKFFTTCKLFPFCCKTINSLSIGQKELFPHPLPEIYEPLDIQ